VILLLLLLLFAGICYIIDNYIFKCILCAVRCIIIIIIIIIICCFVTVFTVMKLYVCSVHYVVLLL